MQISSAAGSIASSTAAIVGASLAIPVLGPAVAAAAALATLITQAFSGCGQTCIQATQIANQVEKYLQQNVDTYLKQPVHYASIQQAFLANFDNAWSQLQQACGNPALGEAGIKCIGDREANACQWKASAGGWAQSGDGKWAYTPAGPAGSGTACWNWFVGYRDPIASDPTVVADPNPISNAEAGIASLLSGTNFNWGSLAIPAAIFLGVLWIAE